MITITVTSIKSSRADFGMCSVIADGVDADGNAVVGTTILVNPTELETLVGRECEMLPID